MAAPRDPREENNVKFMVLMLDGNSEIGAHVCLGHYLLFLMNWFGSGAVTNLRSMSSSCHLIKLPFYKYLLKSEYSNSHFPVFLIRERFETFPDVRIEIDKQT